MHQDSSSYRPSLIAQVLTNFSVVQTKGTGNLEYGYGTALTEDRIEMSTGMQEVVPSGTDREALYRGHSRIENRLHIREALYWMRHLR